MKRSTPFTFVCRLPLPAIILVTFFAAILPTQAQNGWKLLDVNLKSGFQSEFEWPRPGAYMFWRTPLIGYYRTFTETGSNDLKNYKTTDGGTTWSVETKPDPVPHHFLTTDWAYSNSGYTSQNGGTSWEKLYPSYQKKDSLFFPDTTLRYTIVDLTASPDRHTLVAFYQLHSSPGPGQDSTPYGPYRLAFSHDLGQSWVFCDYMTVFGDVLQQIDSTIFGPLPVPENMTTIAPPTWWKLLRLPNDSVLYVATRAYGFVNGNLENHYYMGKLNLNNYAARWTELPFNEPVAPPPAAPLDFQFISDEVAYSIQAKFVDINNPEDVAYTIWRTENGGDNWEAIEGPPWVDYRSLRFTSETHGVTSNAFTNDGGRTWTPWSHIFGRGAIVYPYDSTHYYLANRFSLFASSTDAGHTWKHNESGGIAQAVVGHNGKVFVGRSYQSLMISSDAGETWKDIGAQGELPARLSTIVAFGFPDLLFNPNRIVGIATFVEYDGTFKVMTIESNDGGAVWSVGEEIPSLVDAVGTIRMSFIRDPESETDAPTGFIASSKGLLVSTNGGISWTVRNNTYQFEQVAMADPKFGTAVMGDGIYATSDGGATWTRKDLRTTSDSLSLGLRSFDANSYKALFVNKNAQYKNWSYRTSDDGGQTWAQQNGTNAAQPMDIEAFWSDSIDIHVVGRGGTIQHSDDGGRTFTLKHDVEPSFKLLGGLVAAGQDETNIYVITPANQAGRYEMHRSVVSVPVTPGGIVTGASLSPNPTHGDVALLDMRLSQSTDEVSVRVYDLLGSRVGQFDLGHREAGSYREAFDITTLPSGHYSVEVSTPQGILHAPLVIVR